MTKKQAIIVMGITAALVLGGFGAFYFLALDGKVSLPEFLGGDSGTGDSALFPEGSGVSDGTGTGDDGLVGPGSSSGRDTESESSGTEGGAGAGGGAGGAPLKYGSVFQISNTPVSGADAIILATSTGPVVRYVERSRGNIYDYIIRKGSGSRISIETIPRLHEAYFGANGTVVLGRFISEEANALLTFRSRLAPSNATSSKGLYSLSGRYLEPGISALDVSPSGRNLFYILPSETGSSWYMADPVAGSVGKIASSPLTEWQAAWVDDRYVTLTTKPSALVSGYAFLFDTKSRSPLESIVSAKPGLSVLVSPDRKYTLYYDAERGFGSSVLASNGSAPTEVFIKTLPEKCVWGGEVSHTLFCGVPTSRPTGLIPDDWYSGEISFSDEIWRYELDSGIAERIATVNQFTKGAMDLIQPFLSRDGDYLIFTNKNDLTLWGVRVEE